MLLNYVTSNIEKVRRLKEAFKRYDVKDVRIEHNVMFLPEPRSDDMKEIAEIKARYAFSQGFLFTGPCVVHDAGFFINSLNGFPRGFVNFALDTIGLEGMLRLVEGKPRECEFRDCLAYFNGNNFQYFQTVSRGSVAHTVMGTECSWPLHRIFIPEGETRALAEMSDSEKDEWRGRRGEDYYLNQFVRWIDKNRN